MEDQIIGYRLFYSAIPDHLVPEVRVEKEASGFFKTKEEFDQWWSKHGESRKNTLQKSFGERCKFILKASLTTGHNTPLNNQV